MRPKSPIPSYDDALATLLAGVRPLDAETVNLTDAAGRILRENVSADRDQPPFDRSAMDGFAVRSGEILSDHAMPVSGSVPAGADRSIFEPVMKRGTVMRIATGAPLPTGADAVVPIEKVTVTAGETESVVFAPGSVKLGDNVHHRGSDARAGDGILEAGMVLNPARLGLAAAMGVARPKVTRKLRATVLTTGDEVCDPATPTAQLEPQQIRNSNGPMLLALLRAVGIEDACHEHIKDEPDATLEAAEKVADRSDLVLTVGGISAGQRDWLPGAWQALGMETFVRGVAIQPGKPVLAGRVKGALVIGLPGNPVSVLCTAHLFAWPVIRLMLGIGHGGRLPWRQVTLAEPVKSRADRELFRAASVDGAGMARPIVWHGSGDLAHTARADGFVRMPRVDGTVEAGTPVSFLPLVG